MPRPTLTWVVVMQTAAAAAIDQATGNIWFAVAAFCALEVISTAVYSFHGGKSRGSL